MYNSTELPNASSLRQNHPPKHVLTTDTSGGIPIGLLYESATQPSEKPLVIPPSQRRRHIAHISRSGAGKTTTCQIAALSAAKNNSGLTFIVDPKGGFATEFLPMCYHSDINLEDITVIEAVEALPILPLFTLTPYLDNPEIDISRERLIEIVVDAAMGVFEATAFDKKGFNQAFQSLDLLRTIISSLFNSGLNSFNIEDLVSELNSVSEGTYSVSVSDSRYQTVINTLVNESAKTRKALANGAIRRLTPLLRSSLTADAFGTASELSEQIDFYSLMDDNVVMIFDMSGISSVRREQLGRAVVSQFFVAGRLRQRSTRDIHPLASLFLDEAHVFSDSQILLDIMAEGREFNVGLYLMSQLLSQFSDRSIESLSGNIGTFVCGPSDALAAQAAVDHKYIQTDAKRILGEVPVGDWLVSMTAPRGHMPFDPFVVGALPLPKGHPDSEIELTDAEQASCAEAIRDVYERSRSRPDVVTASESTTSTEFSDQEIARGLRHTLWTASLPDGIEYDSQTDTVHCPSTDETFAPTFEGVCDAVRTVRRDSSLEDVDLPITEIGLQIDPWDVKTAPISLRQLMFLRLIEKAQRRAIDSRAWDIVTQTMRPLRDEVGCTSADEAELKEMGLISLQDELRGKYYHLTDDGRGLLRDLRNGADPPEPKYGDANESAAHIKGVEIAARALGELAQRPSSPVHRVERYWSPPDERTRLDLVGLGVDDKPVVTVEVERPTNDLNTGVPADYDAMADCAPAAAVWLVANRALGHRVVTALVGSSKHEARIPLDPAEIKSSSTPLDRYSFSAPGCTAIRTYSAVTPELFDQLIVEGGDE